MHILYMYFRNEEIKLPLFTDISVYDDSPKEAETTIMTKISWD